MVETGNRVKDVTNATSIANVDKAIYKNAIVAVLNRDNASKAPLVTEWRLTVFKTTLDDKQQI